MIIFFYLNQTKALLAMENCKRGVGKKMRGLNHIHRLFSLKCAILSIIFKYYQLPTDPQTICKSDNIVVKQSKASEHLVAAVPVSKMPQFDEKHVSKRTRAVDNGVLNSRRALRKVKEIFNGFENNAKSDDTTGDEEGNKELNQPQIYVKISDALKVDVMSGRGTAVSKHQGKCLSSCFVGW